MKKKSDWINFIGELSSAMQTKLEMNMQFFCKYHIFYKVWIYMTGETFTKKLEK